MAIDISSIVQKHLSSKGDTVVTEGVEDNTTGCLKVDFTGAITGEKTTIDNADDSNDYVWFMSEDEQSSVSGALLASVVTNNVTV